MYFLLLLALSEARIVSRGYNEHNKYPYLDESHNHDMLEQRMAKLDSKIDNVEANYGYSKVFAMHGQSEESPVCPIGTFTLWRGYSLVRPFEGAAFTDLSDPGSCLKEFDSVPHVLCRGRKCKLRGDKWSSMWLWNRNKASGEAKVGLCSVCESAVSLLVVHSQNTTKPICPTGYTSQHFWSGYSFLSASSNGLIKLSSVGSCLPYFEPTPYVGCNNRGCNVVQSSPSVWLRVSGSGYMSTKDAVKSKDVWRKISRCRICALYTPTLWPRDRRVIS